MKLKALWHYFVERGMPISSDVTCERDIINHVESLEKGVAFWTETARQYAKNEAFYRDIVHKVGVNFGDSAKTSDDGSLQEDVLALKVPLLVRRLKEQYEEALAKLSQITNLAKENNDHVRETPLPPRRCP